MDETSRIKLNKPLAIGAVIVALILGLLVGGALDIGKRLFGGPDPETVASSALQSMRAQNRLVPAAGGSVLAHLVDLERRGLVDAGEGETWTKRAASS
jgi:hypothetical protein